ncbi:MAG TPA: BTAD domain-containing putative transcriptional regulator [Gemmatimonadales bacterium]|jgi:TolB-like protein/DNA-binding SARP family transcriptional activator|nr:BTAD domain-containing putative transcriptional regulator [Gemmatimonadales bacterium]
MIELRTLGALEAISADGTPLRSVLAQPRRMALFGYLALASPRGFHRRDSLFALFWPEHDAEHARHALRQSLYFLRQALGANAIVSRGDEELAVAPDQVRCDAAEFERAIDEGRLEAALALYRGDLLPGFHISDAPDFERWLDQERARLRGRAQEAGWALAGAREREGDAAGAAKAGQAAASLAPTDEAAICRLVLLLDRLGDRTGAVRAYEGFARHLWQEYELQPSEQTQALLEGIRARTTAATAPPAPESPEPETPLARPVEGMVSRPETSRPPARRRRMAALLAGCALTAGTWLAVARHGATSGAGALPRELPRSIAVLPFLNIRGDSSGDYFSDGVTEEILHALAQVPDLRVAARTSAFQFKGKETDVRDVGRQLDVEAVLEGSIQREGDAVRITVQLIDARSGYHLWSGKFDRAVADLFVVEDEISRTIADTLKVSLGLAARPVSGGGDARAHDLYFRGLSLLAQRGASLPQSIAHFESALASDSSFAPAWAGLAAATELLPAFYLSSYAEALPKAERAARKALALDSALGPAYTVLANIHRDRLEWAEAERAYHRALALAPNDPETVQQYGQFLFWSGQAERAVPWLERARRLDPLAPIPAATCGTALLFVHRYDSAAVMLRLASRLGPTLPLPYMWLMWTELNATRYDSAQQAARQGAQAAGIDPQVYAPMIRGVADSARRRDGLAALASIPDTAPWSLSADYRMNWYILLGDTTAALRAVEGLKTRASLFSVLNLWNPALDPIRQHPRFQATLARLGLPYRGTEP